ncbi:transposase [Luedemannella flava]
MLLFGTVPGSWSALLWTFRSCFTAPGFATFVSLVSGLVAAPVRRTVCGMWTAAGLAGRRHHARAHRFFTTTRWCPDELGVALARLIVGRLLPAHAPVLIAVDDTLFRRSGRRVHATGWHHDGSSKGPKTERISWGNCWIVAGIVITLPYCSRPVCLPVAFALWRPAPGRVSVEASKQVIACQLVARISAALPGRQVHVVADAWYAGADGAPGAARGAHRQRGLPHGVTLTSRLRANAALHTIATPVPGAPGRPRRIGQRIGNPKQLAAHHSTRWRRTQVHRYGRVDTVELADHVLLWYGVYRSRAVRVILLREPTARAHDLALITTDHTSTPEQIVARYAARWAIETTFEDAKQTTGVGEAHNRTPTAVTRTVPFGLLTHSLVTIWYTHHGHHPRDVTDRRSAAPWYTTKTEPAYHDMITKLRRTLIASRFRGGRPDQPTPTETLAIAAAWAEAAA